MSYKFALTFLLAAALLLAGCSDPTEFEESVVTGETVEIDGARHVTLTESLTITEAGTYVLTGSIPAGQLTVDASKDAKLELILNGVDIACPTSAALYIKQADKVTITLADGSVNKLTNDSGYVAIDDNNIDAVLFSKEDLEIGGTGTLQIGAASGNGITSKDDLKIEGGVYIVDVGNHALEAKDLLRIKDGSFTLTGGKDALHAENSDDTTLGSIEIEGGVFKLNAAADGIDASGTFTASGCEITLKAAGKGIVSTGDMTLGGGTYVIESTDDALHSNANLVVNDGAFTLTSGDDGAHADSNLKITGGVIDILKSYEGLEGQSIDIYGGTVTLKASDDGINAAGGNDGSGMGGGWGGRGGDMFAADANAYIAIHGGSVTVDADGDGVDSNGSLDMTGGELYVSGPTNSGNGTLDYNGSAAISGGTVIAAGSAGMTQNFGSASTQCAALVNLSGNAGGVITLKDAAGKVLASYTAAKRFQTVIVSHPDLAVGGSCTVEAGGNSVSVTFDAVISGSGGGFGGGGWGGFGGGRGGRQDMQQEPQDKQGGRFGDMTPPELPEDMQGMQPGMIPGGKRPM